MVVVVSGLLNSLAIQTAFSQGVRMLALNPVCHLVLALQRRREDCGFPWVCIPLPITTVQIRKQEIRAKPTLKYRLCKKKTRGQGMLSSSSGTIGTAVNDFLKRGSSHHNRERIFEKIVRKTKYRKRVAFTPLVLFRVPYYQCSWILFRSKYAKSTDDIQIKIKINNDIRHPALLPFYLALLLYSSFCQ